MSWPSRLAAQLCSLTTRSVLVLLEGDVAGEEVCGAHATHLATRTNRLLQTLQASSFHRKLLLFGRVSALYQFHVVQWRNTVWWGGGIWQKLKIENLKSKTQKLKTEN